MNGDQLHMARALLRLGIRELAAISGADKMAIVRMEAGRKPHAATEAKLKAALEARGIVFIGATEPFHEPTVAMRWGMASPAASEGEGAEEESDEEPSQRALGWDEGDFALGRQQVEGMHAFWAERGKWNWLSAESRRALSQFMGGDEH